MTATPNRNSASVTAVRYRLDVARSATHCALKGLCTGCINSNGTFVSSTVIPAALAVFSDEKDDGSPVPLPTSGPTSTKFADECVERRSSSWKPSAVKATLSYLNSAVLPIIGHLQVSSVVRADIACFFHERGRKKPGGANRSHEILRNMFDCATASGHRPETVGNPCKAIVRYPRPPRGRLLAAEDLARLGAVLRQREGENPVCVPAVRPLLRTRCKPVELHSPSCCEGKPYWLIPFDAKTGPRHVLLGHLRPTTTNRYVHLDHATVSRQRRS